MDLVKRFSIPEYQSLFETIFFGTSSESHTIIAQYFSPYYVQTTDGHDSNFEEFVEHINKVRGIVRSGKITVNLLVQEENRIADRHTVEIEKVDGSKTKLEVLLLGERDENGKMLRVWETTKVITGDDKDVELGRVR
ncbi:MAG: hypothetical protein M1834_006424 [Cirrosporium novae-zelandiae]|nr:MAG: hypothetical protein M1834_006424 [Cirrosporium novae-zelandiae]